MLNRTDSAFEMVTAGQPNPSLGMRLLQLFCLLSTAKTREYHERKAIRGLNLVL